MKIRVARHAGFCMGVKKALESLLRERQKEKAGLFTYGPIIHNNQVLELLKTKEIRILPEGESRHQGTVVIRAHGVPPEVKERLRARGLKVVDGTCPKVRWVQGLVKKHIKLGRDVVILGEKEHPEVIGLVGHGMGKPHVIQRLEDIEDLPKLKEPVLLAQTTQERERFCRVAERLREKYPQLLIFDTICNATKERQEEVKALSQKVEAIVVVGGRHSGNTRRLLEVAQGTGRPAFLVETEQEIDPRWFEGINSVGVTAGASTPNWMLIRVLKRLEDISKRRESLLTKVTKATLRFAFYTGILAALSVASVLVGIQAMTKANSDPMSPTIVALLFISMLITARYVDRESLSYNDPNMYQFLVDYRMWVMAFGAFCLLVGLYLSYQHLTWIHTIAGIFMFLGVLGYRMQKKLGIGKAFSMPGTRSLGEAFIFAVLSGPFINAERWLQDPISALFPLFLCLSFGISRSLFQDILHFQGDLLVGEKSLSVLFGDERLIKWLFGVSILQLLLLTIHILSGNLWGIPLLLSSIFFLLIVFAYQKRFILIPSRAEIFSDIAIISTGYFVFILNRLVHITS